MNSNIPSQPAAPKNSAIGGKLNADQVQAIKTQAHETLDAMHQLYDLLNRTGEHTELVLSIEWLDGWLTALACNRSPVSTADWLANYFEDHTDPFVNEQDQAQFMQTCEQRLAYLKATLLTDPQDYDGALLLEPYFTDLPTARQDMYDDPELSAADRAELEAMDMPSMGQDWAEGFGSFVQAYEQDWQTPKDKDLARSYPLLLENIADLQEADEETWTEFFSDGGQLCMSATRENALLGGIVASHELRMIWAYCGARIEPVVGSKKTNPNDPCHCGSGKKFKKCHGL